MKVNNTKGTSGVSKSKKSSKSSKASGVSFDAMVDAAGKVDDVEATAATTAADAVSGITGGSHGVPEDAQGRGEYMLDQLEDLEKDILNGNDSGAIYRLKQAVESEAVDLDNIAPELREILEEIELRASVEIAKMEAAQEDEE